MILFFHRYETKCFKSIDLYKSEDLDIANVAKSIHEEEEKHRYSKIMELHE